jgi:hypothetical protein
MASGFQQRYQGKISANTIYAGGLSATKGGIYVRYTGGQISPRDLQSLVNRSGTSTDPIDGTGSTMPNSGVTALSSSSGTRVLAAPIPGAEKTFYMDAAGSSALRRIYTGSSLTTFDGTNTVFTSSLSGVFQVLGLTTARWLIETNTGTGTLGTTT